MTLQFVEMALEEIAPERLTGYGSVRESLVKPLAGGIQEMKGIVRQIASYLSQRADADLSNRLFDFQKPGRTADFFKSWEASSIATASSSSAPHYPNW